MEQLACLEHDCLFSFVGVHITMFIFVVDSSAVTTKMKINNHGANVDI